MNPLLLGYDAREKPVLLQRSEANAHKLAIGSSGSGKSKFLENLMREHLRNRQGFTLADPHGTLYDDLVAYCAHYGLDRDIILLNVSNPIDTPIVGFNPFERAAEGDVSVQVDRRIIATTHAWGVENTDATPTLNRTLRLIYTVMLEQKLGLPEIRHLIDFNAQEVRGMMIQRLDNPLIQAEWCELQALKAKEWRDETLSAKNRLFKFLTSETLCRFMGLPGRTINLRKIMDEGKVLLVNLAQSDYLSQENARVFGALLVNEFFETALRRRRDEFGRAPRPHFLYLDEFQSFVSVDIANMLDQVRKFGLFLTLAHQRFGQVDDDITDAVLANCRIKAVFGGLPTESARLMAEELFIGELDPQKIKVAIYQTKFWPEYRRDKVYTKGTSRTSSFSTTHSSTSGTVTGTSAATAFFQPNDWFAGMQQSGYTSSSSIGTSAVSSDGYSDSDASGESESVADIPIFFPVPFQELSSVQYYTTEEQLTQLTAALKEQFPRHCFIKIHGQKTQPLLVPYIGDIRSFRFNRANLDWYQRWQLQKHDALPVAEVDRLIQERQAALEQAVAVTASQVIDISSSNGFPARANEPSAPTPDNPIWSRTASDDAGRKRRVKTQAR